MPFSDVIILGDTNFDINDVNTGYSLLKLLLLNYNILHCNDLINGPIQCTYDNTALDQPSCMIISLSHRMNVLARLKFS